MAGGAAVHLVPLRVAQIMQQIFRQAGSKNGHSSWVSRGEAQAASVQPLRGSSQGNGIWCSQTSSSTQLLALLLYGEGFCSEDFVNLYRGA